MSDISIDELFLSLDPFAQRISDFLDVLGLDLTNYQADHIALRVNDETLAKKWHEQWKNYGHEISTNKINGRTIVVFKLKSPLIIGQWQTMCVELPYPGAQKYKEQGWEHIEWVIPSKACEPEVFLQDVFAIYPQLKANWHRLSALDVKVKLSSPKAKKERLANPTVAFKTKGICVKLHPISLEDIIKSEYDS